MQHRLSFPPDEFFFDQPQFSSCLTRNRAVLLCTAHQVRDHVFNGAERQVFTYPVTMTGQVERNIIAHTEQL